MEAQAKLIGVYGLVVKKPKEDMILLWGVSSAASNGEFVWTIQIR